MHKQQQGVAPKPFLSVANKRWLMFAAVVMMCVLPPAASWFMFKFKLTQAFPARYHGELVTPVVKIQSFDFKDAAPYANKQKWLLWYVYPGDCGQQCQHKIDALARLHLSLGDEMLRVDSGLGLLSGSAPFDFSAYQDGKYATFKYWILKRTAFQKRIAHNPQLALAKNGNIYLVDPLGNIFMKYAADTKPGNIFKDIKRVLYASHLG